MKSSGIYTHNLSYPYLPALSTSLCFPYPNKFKANYKTDSNTNQIRVHISKIFFYINTINFNRTRCQWFQITHRHKKLIMVLQTMLLLKDYKIYFSNMTSKNSWLHKLLMDNSFYRLRCSTELHLEELFSAIKKRKLPYW